MCCRNTRIFSRHANVSAHQTVETVPKKKNSFKGQREWESDWHLTYPYPVIRLNTLPQLLSVLVQRLGGHLRVRCSVNYSRHSSAKLKNENSNLQDLSTERCTRLVALLYDDDDTFLCNQ